MPAYLLMHHDKEISKYLQVHQEMVGLYYLLQSQNDASYQETYPKHTVHFTVNTYEEGPILFEFYYNQ